MWEAVKMTSQERVSWLRNVEYDEIQNFYCVKYKQWFQEILQQFFFVALTKRAVAVTALREGVYSYALGFIWWF